LAAAKSFDDLAVGLAVVAHVRHTGTDYDRLLAGGADRLEARAAVAALIEAILDGWKRR